MDVRPLRLLVVEDDPTSAEVAREMLCALGHRCEVVGDGRSFLAAIAGETFDLVFLDLGLPDIDGLDAARSAGDPARAHGGGHPVPLVALTGRVVPGTRESCLSAGMRDMVAKPFTFQDLRSVLDRVAGASVPAAIEGSALEALREMERRTGRRIVAPVVARYQETSERLLQDMERDALEGDVTRLRAAAHALKGASAQLGAAAVASSCAALEGRVAEGGRAELTGSLAALRKAWEAAMLELRRQTGESA